MRRSLHEYRMKRLECPRQHRFPYQLLLLSLPKIMLSTPADGTPVDPSMNRAGCLTTSFIPVIGRTSAYRWLSKLATGADTLSTGSQIDPCANAYPNCFRRPYFKAVCSLLEDISDRNGYDWVGPPVQSILLTGLCIRCTCEHVWAWRRPRCMEMITLALPSSEDSP